MLGNEGILQDTRPAVLSEVVTGGERDAVLSSEQNWRALSTTKTSRNVTHIGTARECSLGDIRRGAAHDTAKWNPAWRGRSSSEDERGSLVPAPEQAHNQC